MSIGPHQVLQLHLPRGLRSPVSFTGCQQTKYHPNIKQTERALLDYLPEVALLHEALQPQPSTNRPPSGPALSSPGPSHPPQQNRPPSGPTRTSPGPSYPLNKIDHRVVLLRTSLGLKLPSSTKPTTRWPARSPPGHTSSVRQPAPGRSPHAAGYSQNTAPNQPPRSTPHAHNPNRFHVALIQEGHQEVEEKFHSSLKPIKPLNLINLHLLELHSINRQQTKDFSPYSVKFT